MMDLASLRDRSNGISADVKQNRFGTSGSLLLRARLRQDRSRLRRVVLNSSVERLCACVKDPFAIR